LQADASGKIRIEFLAGRFLLERLGQLFLHNTPGCSPTLNDRKQNNSRQAMTISEKPTYEELEQRLKELENITSESKQSATESLSG
jgi:hypothetical protein